MINLFYKIFSLSFNSFGEYNNSINEILKWESNRRKITFSLNNIIFNFIKKKRKRRKSNDQFILDYINFFIHYHLSNRYKLLNKGVSKSKFVFSSFFKFYFFAFKTLLSSIKIYAFDFELNKIPNIKKCTICIGFPKHSFNYSKKYMSYPSSFIEYLMINDFINFKDNIISIDEYIRPSFETETNKLNQKTPDNFDRNIISKKFNSLKFLKIIFFIPYYYYYFVKTHQSLSFLLFSYFLRNEIFSKTFSKLFNNIKNKNIIIKNIFVLNQQNISGIIYNGEFNKIIRYFNYGQHYIIGTSSINSSFIGTNKNLERSAVTEELQSRLFSEFHLNPINFSQFSKNFSKARDLINKYYGTNIIDSKSKIEKENKYFKENSHSNLGYEKIEILKFTSPKNILFCDNSIDSKELNFSRELLGDFLALKNFMYNFHREIVEVSKELKYDIYFKGKYKNNQLLNSLMDEISSEFKLKIHKINPYSKIIISENKKFNFNVNFPFTSTHLTLKKLSDKSLFYIPSNFVGGFDPKINDICLGKKSLNNLLKK